MKRTTRFKQYLRAKEILMIPIAHDRLCATMIERAGFKAPGCVGYGNSAALICAPDIELLTQDSAAFVPKNADAACHAALSRFEAFL